MNTVWDPETIARAARIQLRARELAWGYRIGQHASESVWPKALNSWIRKNTPLRSHSRH